MTRLYWKNVFSLTASSGRRYLCATLSHYCTLRGPIDGLSNRLPQRPLLPILSIRGRRFCQNRAGFFPCGYFGASIYPFEKLCFWRVSMIYRGPFFYKVSHLHFCCLKQWKCINTGEGIPFRSAYLRCSAFPVRMS